MAHTVTVREVMSAEFLGVHEGESVAEVASALADHREDTAIVLDGRHPIGTVTAVDLLTAVVAGADEEAVGAYMRAPVSTVEPGVTIEHAIERLAVSDDGWMVVVDTEGDAVGVVGPRDLLGGAGGLLDDHLEATLHDDSTRSPHSMSDQGVCEACGRLADSLHESNGTLLCAACADL